MDNKKIVADFINNVCRWVCYEYVGKDHDSFIENMNDSNIAYLLKDKGIEKRIQNQLSKRLNLNVTVQYEVYPVGYGKIFIKLSKDKYIPTIKMPRELLGGYGL